MASDRSARPTEADRPPVAGLRLEMSLVDEDGTVVAHVTEPFEVGRFDLAAARQGMRKMLQGMGGIGDDDSDTEVGSFDL